jgi:hypothetical protein
MKLLDLIPIKESYTLTNDNRVIANDKKSWERLYGIYTNALYNPKMKDILPYIKGMHSGTEQIKFKNKIAAKKFYDILMA